MSLILEHLRSMHYEKKKTIEMFGGGGWSITSHRVGGGGVYDFMRSMGGSFQDHFSGQDSLKLARY